MESAKEKAIREAYGEYWDKLKEFIDENGYINDDDAYGTLWEKVVDGRIHGRIYHIEVDIIDRGVYDDMRPKLLSGINNNNGWHKIKTESDLPTTRSRDDVFLVGKDGIIATGSTYLLTSKEIRDFWVCNLTHYQTIIKPQPPIY